MKVEDIIKELETLKDCEVDHFQLNHTVNQNPYFDKGLEDGEIRPVYQIAIVLIGDKVEVRRIKENEVSLRNNRQFQQGPTHPLFG